MQPIIAFLIGALLFVSFPVQAQTPGAMDYDAGAGKYMFYDGTSWDVMGNALYLPLGSCPVNGRIEYDGLLPDLKYCGNGQWRSFSVGLTLTVCLTPGTWKFENTLGKYVFCNGLVWVTMNSGSMSLAGL